MQSGEAAIPQDHGNQYREDYLGQLSPDKQTTYNNELAKHGIESPHDAAMNRSAAEAEVTAVVNKGTGSHNTPGNATASKGQAFTRKRFYKLIYSEVRNLILNGDIPRRLDISLSGRTQKLTGNIISSSRPSRRCHQCRRDRAQNQKRPDS